MQARPHRILHIATRTDWKAAASSSDYTVATLETEGFIHCAEPGQIDGVAARYFRGCSELVLLEVDPDRVGVRIVWEESAGAGQTYPHVYGPIPVAAVTSATDITVDAEGVIRH